MAKEQKVEDHKPAKVDKWDTIAVKNALDDAAKKLMEHEFGCDEDHSLMNGRLILSAIGVGFSIYAVVWDYLHPFPESKPVLIVCVLSYFVLMGILTLYMMYKEKGIFYMGLEKDKAGIDPPNHWRFSSAQNKYDDIYKMTIEYKEGDHGAWRETELNESVTKFFDETGTLREDIFLPKLGNLCSSLRDNKKKQ